MSSYFDQRMAEIGPPPAQPKRGFIYFAMADDGDCVKIGFTTDIGNRLAALRTGSQQDIRIKASFASYQIVERMVHQRFQSDRIRGEWFRVTPALTDLLDDIEDYQSDQAKSDDGSFKSYRANMPGVFFEVETVERLLSGPAPF